MRGKQPAIGTYRVLGAAMTATPGSAFKLQFRDRVEKEKLAAGERRRPLLCGRKFKSFSKALVGATLGCGANLSFVEMRCDVRHAWNGSLPFGPRTFRFRGPKHSGGAQKFRIGKESGLPVAHRDGQPLAHEAIVLKEENAGVALARVSGDFDFVAQGFAAACQPVMKRHVAAEHAVDALAAHLEVDAEP